MHREYDTMLEFNVDSKAERDQLNLAHAARNKNKQSQCPFNSVQLKIHDGRIMETDIKTNNEFQ